MVTNSKVLCMRYFTVSTALMEMSKWLHYCARGKTASHWCGIPHALTSLHPPIYAALTTNEALAVAAKAEVRKCDKYCYLLSSHTFESVAIETMDAFGLNPECP